jgi:hypothetical protein
MNNEQWTNELMNYSCDLLVETGDRG